MSGEKLLLKIEVFFKVLDIYSSEMKCTHIFALSLCLSVSLLLIGCGSGSGGGVNTTPTPAISSVSPSSFVAGSAAQTITVTGSGFISGSVVEVSGVAEATTYVSSTQLTATVPATQLTSGGNLTVIVSNGATTSSATPADLVVNDPSPTITSLTPATEVVGGTGAAVTLTGTGFLSTTVIDVNGSARPTTFSNSAQVSAALSAADLATAGTLSLTAVNPTPGGGISAAAVVTIDNTSPTIASVSPTTEVVGTSSSAVTVTGTGFLSTTVINVNGSARPTTLSSSTHLSVTLSTADVATAATLSLTAVNPSPGGGTSSVAVVTVDNPSPTIASVSPTTEQVGATNPKVTVTGTNYVSTTVINVNGSARPTTFTSSTQVSVALSAADLATAGTLSLSAVNPTPGGGSSAQIAVIVANPVAQLISISPATVSQGSAPTINLSGSGFDAASVGTWNGSQRPTTFISSTSLQVGLTASDTQTAGVGLLAVINPAPGGNTSSSVQLSIVPVTPIISSVTPSSALVGANGNTPLPVTIYGSNFAANATLTINSSALAIISQTSTSISTAIPSSYLAQAGKLDLVVTNPEVVSTQSAPYVFNVVAIPIIGALSPVSAPIGSPNLTLQVTGAAFLPDSIVNWNGIPLATQLVVSNYGVPTLNATLPAADVSLPTIAAITVSSPENAGAISQPQAFPTYLSLPSNMLAYNAKDGMLYASVPGYAGPGLANSVVAINPTTGAIARTIPVGSEPDKLSISDSGTVLYVSLDGAAAVKQIDLTGATPSLEFPLGEYDFNQTYSYPITASSVAALPGEPNSVAVLESNADVVVYDSGVARQKTAALGGYFNQNPGSLSFGPSAGTLYSTTRGLTKLSLDSTGFTSTSTFTGPYFAYSSIQYDAGNVYFNDGAVLNATTGAQVGQFYTSGTHLAAGPIVSDSTLGRAWILPQNALTPEDTNQILAFDETTLKQVGAIVLVGTSVSGPNLGAVNLVRWGQNGLAFNTANQIFMLQSPVVKDVSQSPADLSVGIQGPATASTGSSITYSITVTNRGPVSAAEVSVSTTLADAVVYQGATASMGSCSGTSEVICSLGTLASGTSATVQVTATVLNPGSIESTAVVSSSTYDPVQSNNIATATTMVSGAAVAATPVMTSISPAFILAGSNAITLTINGIGFSSFSTVSWNGNALPTTYLSGTQLTSSVPSSYLATLGWGQVTVSTPSPGGGESSALVVSIYQSMNVPAADVLYEPFTRKLYATIPSSATNIAANSLVQIDPLSGTVGTPMVLGNGPNVMTETGDGKFLYIGFSGNNTLGQFNLLNQSITGSYPLSVPGQGSQAASGLAVQPGSDTTLAINFNYSGAGIFDISGNTGAFRPNSGGGEGVVFGDATHLYSESSNTADEYLNRYTVDANGLTLVDSTGLSGLGGTAFEFALGQDGLVYGDNGGIVNPATTPPSQVALLPITPGASGYGLSGDAVMPDSAQHKTFLVGENSAGSFTAYLERFDTTNYTYEANVELPIPSGSGEEGYQILRWGQDGLAVRAYDPIYGSLAGYQLLLFKGPFVLPAEAQSNPVPGLTSVTPAAVVHGSGNQYLTATGSGFIPGAVVLWNGVARTTTYIDAGHLQFDVSATDVASSQTISLTAENPGSSASAGLALTIN